jgi:hypothetical protein
MIHTKYREDLPVQRRKKSLQYLMSQLLDLQERILELHGHLVEE